MDVDEAGTGDRVFIDDADEALRGDATQVHGTEQALRAQSPDQAARSPGDCMPSPATVVVGASPTVTLPLRDDSPFLVQQAAAQHGMIAADWAHLTQPQRWLLYLRHANKCQAPEGQCPLLTDCHVVRDLLVHGASCKDDKCGWRNCVFARHALGHYEVCRIENCDNCAPVRAEMRRQYERQKQQLQLAQRSAELTGDAVMDAGGDEDGGDEESGSDEDSDEEAVEEEMDDEGEDGDEMEEEPRAGGTGDGDGVQAPMAATADVQHTFYSEEEDAALRDFAKRCGT
jgi:TAZ zinc finger